MKEIILATSRNSFFREPFIKGGFSVREVEPPFTDLTAAAAGKGAVLVYELKGSNLSALENFTMKNNSVRVICIAGRDIHPDPARLSRAGVFDLLIDPEPAALFSYVGTVTRENSGGFGRIILLDDNTSASNVIRGICSTMGYRVENVSTVPLLLESLAKPAIQFVIVNIGMNRLNIRELINSFSARPDLKSLPVIVYKDMAAGIFVHEIAAGLNRITRSIVSSEELYGFLASNLFKKRFMPAFFSLGAQLDADKNICYAKDTISRIIFSGGCSLFEGDNLFNDHSPVEMMDHLDSMNSLLVAVSGLKWLIRERKSAPFTCGEGVLC